jgi:hypothetical protein
MLWQRKVRLSLMDLRTIRDVRAKSFSFKHAATERTVELCGTRASWFWTSKWQAISLARFEPLMRYNVELTIIAMRVQGE